MKPLLLALSVFISVSSFSQNGGLKGHVINRTDKGGFAGLQLSILKGDSVIKGTITDQNGDYQITQIEQGKYNLKLQFLGFKERVIRNIEIQKDETLELNLIHPDSCSQPRKICPKGHLNDLIPIVYGLPGKKMMKQSVKGKIKLGGCIITDCDPKWYCRIHSVEF